MDWILESLYLYPSLCGFFCPISWTPTYHNRKKHQEISSVALGRNKLLTVLRGSFQTQGAVNYDTEPVLQYYNWFQWEYTHTQ